jgi:hypothetical protein
MKDEVEDDVNATSNRRMWEERRFMHCGIVLVDGKKIRSNVSHARRPRICNSLDFLNEFTTGDLGGANSLLGICGYWRVFIRIVERVS